MRYNEMLLKVPFSKEKIAEINKETVQTFNLYARETQKEGALMIIALQPDKDKREYNLEPIVKQLNISDQVKVYDLLPYYRDELKNATIANYYWKGDGHHNAKGYALMARAMKKAIDSFGVDLIRTKLSADIIKAK